MKYIWRILKWIGLSIGILLTAIILAGLAFRLFGPKPQPPQGELIDVGGFKLHINTSGVKSNTPTLVIEAGAGGPTEFYHWLSEGVKDSMRVVRYDRAGLGYSDASNTPRSPETIARELHMLLEKAGESPPYILAGHSMGGPYIRVFTQLYPEEVVGLFFLDSTHPERVEHYDLPLASSSTFKFIVWASHAAAVLGDLGVVGLYDRLFGPILPDQGLPAEMNQRVSGFLLAGKSLRANAKEMETYHSSLKRAGKANEFGSIPIRVFTAIEMNKEAYRARGIDPDQRLAKNIALQKEYTQLSTDGKQFLIDGNHQSIFTRKENADIICQEVLQLLEELKH